MIEDFTARRRAAIEAQQALSEIEKAENEVVCEVSRLEQEFEHWLERERIKRQKYEQAMLAKRLAREGGTL